MAFGAWPSWAQESGSTPLSGEGHLGCPRPGASRCWCYGAFSSGVGAACAVASGASESPLEGPAFLVQAPGSLDGAPLTDVLRKEVVMQERGSCSKIVSIEEALFVFIEMPLWPGHPTLVCLHKEPCPSALGGVVHW